MVKKYISCWDLKEAGHSLPGCCSSCHEDCEEGDGELCEFENDEYLVMVCCNVSNFLDDKKLTFEDFKKVHELKERS